MATIKELVDAHSTVPGDIRVSRPDRAEWLRPFYQVDARLWRGKTPTSEDCLFASYCDMVLYTEPKPKVMRAQYLVTGHRTHPYITVGFFIDEREVRAQYGANGATFTRLEEREFDK